MWDGRPLPVTDLISDGVVSLPIYTSLSDESVDKVCEVIQSARELSKATRAGG
jgi:dTDP-4-amino-4,6-dideoxygalactose transaminase